jgi:hypothetical protein
MSGCHLGSGVKEEGGWDGVLIYFVVDDGVLGIILVFLELIQASSPSTSLLSVSKPGGKLLPRVQKGKGLEIPLFAREAASRIQGFSGKASRLKGVSDLRCLD